MKGKIKIMLFKFNKKLQKATDEILLILIFVFVLLYLRWITSRSNEDHLLITNRSTDKLNKQIFLLAGQSNMAGQGGVYNFSWDGIWEIAHEPLNYVVDCLHNCGLGPGMAFANPILEKDPNFEIIGLVRHVLGQGLEFLINRARVSVRYGGTIRGLLWYHGESDSKDKYAATHYKSKFIKFIHDLRAHLNPPLLPVLVVVLHYPQKKGKFKFVNVVRQAQMDIELPNVIKVDANGLQVGSDGIHLTTQGQVQLGNMMAQAFLNTKFQSVKKFNSNKIYHMM
ncbi:unnamed protein product [Withania somnifera]